jgi:hypothetical protein
MSVHEIDTQNAIIYVLDHCHWVLKFSSSNSHINFIDTQWVHFGSVGCDAPCTFL